jgi:sentrin-specific protease 8
MAATHQVLNYHDVQLYASDVALFAARQWLNDNAINFYLQFLYRSRCLPAGARGEEVLLMDPVVVSCLLWQCENEEEYAELAHGLGLAGKRLWFVPVSDSASLGGASSHWSLLVFDAQQRRFAHYDSSAEHNAEAAERVAREVETLLRASSLGEATGRSYSEVVHVRDAPQQTNGYDCGMYVLLVAEYLSRAHLGDALPPIAEYVTPERVTDLRMQMPELVRRLQREQQQ